MICCLRAIADTSLLFSTLPVWEQVPRRAWNPQEDVMCLLWPALL